MVKSAARVPTPFYAPVRTDAGPLRPFGRHAGRPMLLKRLVPVVAVEPTDGLLYHRDGRLPSQLRVGSLIDVYA